VARGLDERTAVLVSQMDWQSENALLYASRWERRDLAWTRLADVLPHFPFFVRDNHDIERDIVLTAGAAAEVIATYGPMYTVTADDTPALTFPTVAAALPRGTPYVLTLLTPPREERLDTERFDSALRTLTAGRGEPRTHAAYQAWAGLAGEAPLFSRKADRPFRSSVSLAGDRLTIRMDSWLPVDTFRRGSFGHVIRNREHLMPLERGVSLWVGTGRTSARVYEAGLYAPKPRFRIPRPAILNLASLPRQENEASCCARSSFR
jgi:hypothetical protein